MQWNHPVSNIPSHRKKKTRASLTNHPIKTASIKLVSRNWNQRVQLSLIFSIFLSLVLYNGLFSIGTQQQRDPLLRPRVKATFLPQSWWISVHSRSVYSHVMKPPVRREGFAMSALWTFCPAPRCFSFQKWSEMWCGHGALQSITFKHRKQTSTSDC